MLKTVTNHSTMEIAVKKAKTRPAVRKSEDVFQWVVMSIFVLIF